MNLTADLETVAVSCAPHIDLGRLLKRIAALAEIGGIDGQ